jgi:putative peptide zinc metalloprotease protein
VLRRADGVELIGEFEDSGFKESPLLARRADGQVIQLTELLYAVVEGADGRRDVDEVADFVSGQTGRPVSADNIAVIAEKKLRPLGVLALADGTTPEVEKREPLMALRHRKPLLSERVVNGGARLFTWLHLPFPTVAVLLAVAAFDYWLFGVHGIAGGLRSVIYNPELLLAVLASVVVATAFHEFGHASACRYGGARPGVMGVGFYLIWPAFYCDVTDAYRLNRKGRLRTDLGGVYFNAIVVLIAGGVYLATGEEAALLVAVIQHVIVFQQLLPLLRFDGYYVLTDLTGVPDILSRIKPIFRSLVRGRKHEPQVAELRPGVRLVVTSYLVLLVPVLLFMFAWMVIGVPRIVATVFDSFGLQVDRIGAASGAAEGAVAVLRMLILVLPMAAMLLSLSRAIRALGRGLTRWSSGSVPRRIAAIAFATALVGAVGYIWWPNGDYQPIRPGERGTLGETLASMPESWGGRPSFTPERELQYGSEPTIRAAEASRREERERPGGERSRREGEVREGAGAGSAFGRGVESGGDGDDDALGWPYDLDESETGADDSGSYSESPGDTTTDSGTAPAPSQPAPSDSGTTTTEPAPSDGTSTAPSEPAPTTTETTPPPTETTPTDPAPDSTEQSTETAPLTTESVPLPSTTPDTTTTAPDTTTTTPIP